jgi:FkbM family methyltransferase
MKELLKNGLWGIVSRADRIVRPKLRIFPAYRIQALPEIYQLTRFLGHFDVDCVFDVGANVGQYATMLRRDVGYSGTIISFEPIPECAHQLRKLASSDPGWIVEETALSSKVGVATFNVMTDSQFSSLSRPDHSATGIFRSKNCVQREITVSCDTIANIFDSYKSRLKFARPFLKMDTQGSDLDVAMGAQAKLREFVGLQSELAILPIYAEAPTYQAAIAFYETQGFQLTAFVPNNDGHFPFLIETDCIMFNSRFAA